MHLDSHTGLSNPTEVDVAIIGTGTAGMAAYRAAARHTDRIALIEGGAYGTTCARVGCMPSKLLIAAADAAHQLEEAHHFGIGPALRAQVDGERVMARVRSERDRFVGFVTRTVDEFPERHRFRGQARFLDARTIQVGEQAIRARATVIATGSRSRVVPMYADLGDGLVVNDDVFSWETLPKSVAVIGPGIIGLELGQALHRLGVRVRILGIGGYIGPLTDPAVKAEALKLLAAELPLQVDARILSAERIEGGVRLRFECQNQVCEETFEYLLCAIGRTPNVDRLGLETTGLRLDARGVPEFDPLTMQCGSSSIFIAGDANADRPLLHEAADEGTLAGDNAGRYPEIEPGHRRSPLSVVFSDPQIGMAGRTWKELQDSNPVVGRVSFDDQGRSRVMRINRGLLHVYASRQTGQLLGAELVGPRAEHLAHLLAWSHQQGLTIQRLLEMPFYHPVVEEGLRTALRDAAVQLRASGLA